MQLRLADSENGALWPPADEGANSYVITGNPILTRNLDQEILQPVLDNIRARLARATYTPCKVSVPASMNIHAGNSVQITDKNGVTLTAYVMTKTQAGQKDILESTGSARRDSSSAVNNKTQAEKDAAMEDYADSAADKAVKAQTADEVLRRLTNDYQIQGLWQQDGEWYFNAQAVHVLNLVANLITAGKLQSVDKKIYFDLDSGEIVAIGDSGGVSIKDGQFVYEAPGAKGKISFGAFGGDMGGPAIMVKDSVGTNKVGIVSFNGESYFLCKNVDTFAFSIGSIGRKTISYLDANGNVQTEDFYVSY